MNDIIVSICLIVFIAIMAPGAFVAFFLNGDQPAAYAESESSS